MTASRGIVPGGLSNTNAFISQYARINPAAPPNLAKSKLTVINCLINRHPQFVIHAVEDLMRRQHAYDGVRFFVERDARADDVRVSAETAVPQSLRQDHDLLIAYLLFLHAEIAPQRGLHAKHLEVVRRN